MAFHENPRIKIPAILHLTCLGWAYITPEKFAGKMPTSSSNLEALFRESASLEEMEKQRECLRYA
jgi:hypothetical protein